MGFANPVLMKKFGKLATLLDNLGTIVVNAVVNIVKKFIILLSKTAKGGSFEPFPGISLL